MSEPEYGRQPEGERTPEYGRQPEDDEVVPASVSPAVAVTDGIQRLMAARLGRSFLPLAGLFVWGAVGLALGRPGAASVGLGAIVTGVAVLAYGMRIVRRALGGPDHLWMSAALAASIVPPLYAIYLLGWRGLRGLTVAAGFGGVVTAILYVALGVWVLRSWMNVVEIERLARIMVMNLRSDGESV